MTIVVLPFTPFHPAPLQACCQFMQQRHLGSSVILPLLWPCDLSPPPCTPSAGPACLQVCIALYGMLMIGFLYIACTVDVIGTVQHAPIEGKQMVKEDTVIQPKDSEDRVADAATPIGESHIQCPMRILTI